MYTVKTNNTNTNTYNTEEHTELKSDEEQNNEAAVPGQGDKKDIEEEGE